MRDEVMLRIECLMPEKLIERCTARGARFDSVQRQGERVLLTGCDAASAKLLLATCERYGIPAKLTRRRGGSALIGFLKRRPTLPLGFALAAALCALFLGRVWLIDVAFTGQNAPLGDRAALARSIERMGVRPGMSLNIDTALLARTLQAGTGDYSYVGARVQGVRLLVEAAPEAPAPAVYDVEAPRDLVCATDGIVTRAIARSGELNVKPGDAVRRGQLLIRGEEKSDADQTRPIAALGEVVVRTWFEGRASLPLRYVQMLDTGRASTGASLIGPGFEWPLSRARRFASQRVEREYLAIGGMYVPIEIRRTTSLETRTVDKQTDVGLLKQRLRTLALADAFTALALKGPDDWSLGRSWVEYAYQGDALSAQAVLEINTNAAVTREALSAPG